MLFDAHVHLGWFSDPAAIAHDAAARELGMLAVTVTPDEYLGARKTLAAEKNVALAAGLHPWRVRDARDADALCVLLPETRFVGEIGLDYHWMSSTKEKQRAFFEAQLELANRLGLPVIVHDREAHGDTLEILKKYKPKGVLHAFSGSREMAKEILDIGMYLGFGGVLTFKNARKATEVLQEIPKERILFETDCPYMSPEPFRGRRNDSAKIAFVAQKAASLLGCTAQEIIDVTAENAKRLFWSGE